MGINNSCIRLLMREGNREKFCGKILQLGKQTVVTTEKKLNKSLKKKNLDWPIRFAMRDLVNLNWKVNPQLVMYIFFRDWGLKLWIHLI